jgi:DNA-binding beta-propeller fold protein YncE
MRPHPLPKRVSRALCALAALGAVALPATAPAAPTPQRSRPPVTALGALIQLPGSSGCLVDRSSRGAGCTRARALAGPAPFLGSEAIAISPDGRNVYVAASQSNAIAVFKRNVNTGRLTQGRGAAGCVAVHGAGGCAPAVGLMGPNSVTVSADGRNVYSTSLDSDAVDIFRRNPATGALSQPAEEGCIANVPSSGCTAGRALHGPDVVTVSPDGLNVYVGSFEGSSIAVFARNPSTGALAQPAGTTGCIVEVPASGCASALALASPEGMAISADGNDVYVAAALSGALDTFSRNASTGALAQLAGGAGCIVDTALSGCTLGVQVGGADAVAVSPDDDDVYVTSFLSNSVTAFTRTATTGQLSQQAGTSACAVYLLAVGCSLARAFSAPEGLAVSPDGASVYTTAFASAALGVFNRNSESGALIQKPRSAGCMTTSVVPDCTRARALLGASAAVVSPDGRNVYSAAFDSNAVAVFKRITRPALSGR